MLGCMLGIPGKPCEISALMCMIAIRITLSIIAIIAIIPIIDIVALIAIEASSYTSIIALLATVATIAIVTITTSEPTSKAGGAWLARWAGWYPATEWSSGLIGIPTSLARW